MEKILITGNMRSGTTFLANFLNAQKHITIFRDTFHALAGKMLGDQTKLLKLDYKMPLSNNEKIYLLDRISDGFKMLGNIVDYKIDINLNDFETLEELYDIMLRSIAENEDKVVGHKVTECELNVESIVTQTDVKVIYIVRDPRDVVLSSVKKFKMPLEHYLFGWKNRVELVQTAIDNPLSADKILCVKYEDIIENSPETRSALQNFLNVDITYDVSTLRDFKNKWVSNSSFGDVKQIYDISAVYRWKNNITEDVIYIQNETIDFLNRFGYEIWKDGYQDQRKTVLDVNANRVGELELEKQEGSDEVEANGAVVMNDLVSNAEIVKHLESLNKKILELYDENNDIINRMKISYEN